MTKPCFICTTPSKLGLENSGDYTQVRCPRCGPYVLTGTAKAILPGRMEHDHDAFARLSHAVRSKTTEENWYEVTSSNLDELLAQNLPPVNVQRTRFLVWLKGQMNGDDLSLVKITPELHASIVGFIGAKKIEGVMFLIKDLAQDGLLENVSQTFSSPKLRITSSGYEYLDSLEPGTGSREVSTDISPPPQSIKSDCPECGHNRNANLLAMSEINGSDGLISWSDTFYIVKCAGCETSNVKHEYWFSEWDYIDYDPQTGQPRMNPGIEVKYFKPIQKRKMPDYIDRLEDDTLSNILSETYQSFENDMLFLASIGTRAAIDKIMVLKVGDVGAFPQKLKEMKNAGFIAESEKEILETMIDVGSASTHRGHIPSKKTLNRVLDTIEGLLSRFFVVAQSLEEIKRETPER